MREDDYSLYDGTPPHQKHSATSEAAAMSIRKSIGPSHKKIIEYLALPRDATDEQMMSDLDMSGNTLRPRRRELQLMGRIVDAGTQRPTRSGRMATVWKLAALP